MDRPSLLSSEMQGGMAQRLRIQTQERTPVVFQCNRCGGFGEARLAPGLMPLFAADSKFVRSIQLVITPNAASFVVVAEVQQTFFIPPRFSAPTGRLQVIDSTVTWRWVIALSTGAKREWQLPVRSVADIRTANRVAEFTQHNWPKPWMETVSARGQSQHLSPVQQDCRM
jgi:hypothetical protein